jgi:Trk K+ transport system NAD-binding subunit
MASPSQTTRNTNNHFLTRLGQTMSRLFRQPRQCVIVVGCDARVKLLATGLAAVGKEVSLIKPATNASTQTKAPHGVSVVHSSRLGVVALERAGANAAICLVAATADDEVNLRLCREARDRFGVPLAIARLKLVEGVTNWARVNGGGMARMTWGETVRAIVGRTALSQSLSNLASVSDDEQIVDFEMRSPVFLGLKTADLPLGDCEVLAITRNGVPLTDVGAIELRINDVLTLTGTKTALKEVQTAVSTL